MENLASMKDLALLLFAALDDTVQNDYRQERGEYPSGLSIQALQTAEEKLGVKSLALQKMEDNLAADILKPATPQGKDNGF